MKNEPCFLSVKFSIDASTSFVSYSLRISIGSERIDGLALCIIHDPNWCLFKFDVQYHTQIENLF